MTLNYTPCVWGTRHIMREGGHNDMLCGKSLREVSRSLNNTLELLLFYVLVFVSIHYNNTEN